MDLSVDYFFGIGVLEIEDHSLDEFFLVEVLFIFEVDDLLEECVDYVIFGEKFVVRGPDLQLVVEGEA